MGPTSMAAWAVTEEHRLLDPESFCLGLGEQSALLQCRDHLFSKERMFVSLPLRSMLPSRVAELVSEAHVVEAAAATEAPFDNVVERWGHGSPAQWIKQNVETAKTASIAVATTQTPDAFSE